MIATGLPQWRHALFLLSMALFLYFPTGQVRVAAFSQCDTICNTEASCDTWCMNDLWETTCGQAGGFAAGYCQSECGDGYCASGEDSSSCSDDCGGSPPYVTCGDNTCDVGESPIGCSADCLGGGDPYCGDSKCQPGETGSNCPSDCTFSGDTCAIAAGPYCPSGWQCAEGRCLWQNDPILVCCHPAAGGPGMCAVGEICKQPPPGYDCPMACMPAWPI
jgi:hypothetical protein